jgi:protocatechuate 3,4-dioxygenase, alpha subunit
MSLGQTPSQTVGPFFAYSLAAEQYGYPFTSLFPPRMAQPRAQGEHIRVTGRLFDGEGKTIPDAMLEISHVDANGRAVTSREAAVASGFRGFGRCGTGTSADQSFEFHTLKPGAAAPGSAPHINVIVTMRGMLVHAFTRLYFEDEAAANAADPVLASVPAERRATLLAKRIALPGGIEYRFDIHMQGPNETVFFDL